MRELMTIRAGVCRHCGRGEGNLLRGPDGEEVGWTDAARTCCTYPSCVKAEASRKRRLVVASRLQRLTSADVHALIRGRGRKRSCRAAKSRGCI